MGTFERYEALNIKIINRLDGEVDNLKIRFKDLWGEKAEAGYSKIPHIWTNNGQSKWHGWTPANAEIKQLAAEVGTYLAVFTNRDIVQEKAKPTKKNDKTSLIKPLREVNNTSTEKTNTKKKKSEQDL